MTVGRAGATGSATLLTPPTVDVLNRLHADDARTHLDLTARRSERPTAAADQTSAEFWANFRDVHLAVSPDTGRLLYFLARSAQARSIVEFGTSFGVSTIYLAAALRDNGGGQLIGSEFEAGKASAARDNLEAAGLGDIVDVRIGDATETLCTGLNLPIDMVLLDGAKPLYLDVLRILEPSLRANAVIVADNASRSPEYLDYVRNSGNYLSLPGLGDDVEISLRLHPPGSDEPG